MRKREEWGRKSGGSKKKGVGQKEAKMSWRKKTSSGRLRRINEVLLLMNK